MDGRRKRAAKHIVFLYHAILVVLGTVNIALAAGRIAGTDPLEQCEKKCHVVCLKDHNMQNLEELPEGNWFCSTSCSQIHSTLINFVACGENNLPDSILSLIKKKHKEKGLDTGFDHPHFKLNGGF